jgi:N4-gp56 family major capsid protein
MSNAYTASTAVSTIPAYYHKRFLERLEAVPKLYDLLPKRALPENSGHTMYFPRMSSSSTTTSAYKSTQGTLLSTEGVNDVRVSATIETFRNAKAVWDVAKLTALNTYLDEVVDEQGAQARNIIDKRILEEAYGINIGQARAISDYLGGENGATFSSIYLSGTTYEMAATHSTATITAAAIRDWVKRLRARNVQGFFDDGMYLLVVHSDTEMAIQADSTWQAAYQYTDPENMRKGLFGQYGGVKMQRDNNILVSACGSAGATLYFSLLLGKGAMATSELNGGVHTYMKESGPTDTFNPVNEFVSFGWKIHFVPKVLNVSAGFICVTADA